MRENNNKNLAITVALAAAAVSIATIAGVVSRNLKRNLIKDLNDSEFENFNGHGNCCSHNCCTNDSYDDVLRYRKNRYYQRSRY